MSSPLPEISSHLATFFEHIEQRKSDAKKMLRSQIDVFMDDLFSELVAEFTSIIQGDAFPVKATLGAKTSSAAASFQNIESVVCEPIIEMCLLDGTSNSDTVHNSKLKNSIRNRSETPESLAEFSEMDFEHLPALKAEKYSDSESDDADIEHSELLKCPEDHCEATFQQIQELHGHIIQVHQIPIDFRETQNASHPGSPSSTATVAATTTTSAKPWICSICTKVMKNERTLYMHKWRYHKVGQFKCTQNGCDYIASYRIQLRTHHIRFHDLGKFTCPFPGCGRSFNRRNSLKRHERIHLRLKPYRCKVCEYASELRSSMIDHVRVTHFRLPRSRKEQMQMKIGDERDPADYFEVISEGLDLLEPVLEHVNSVLEQAVQSQRGGRGGLTKDSGGREMRPVSEISATATQDSI